MLVIDIHHPHSLGKQACRARVDAVVHELSNRFGLAGVAWDGDSIGFAGHGIEGKLSVTDDDAHVQVRLGPLAGLLRPLIEAEIRDQLRERLG